ncbi:MAG TPA: hypothetical protein VEZ46_16730 [Mycobacteriales bacterium]|nr:hypothetical protein [Mycobacteriales bacterium]
MSSRSLRRTVMVLPALALVATTGTAALASPRKDPAQPTKRHQQVSKAPAKALKAKSPKAKAPKKLKKVAPQIGTAITIVRNADGTITVTER